MVKPITALLIAHVCALDLTAQNNADRSCQINGRLLSSGTAEPVPKSRVALSELSDEVNESKQPKANRREKDTDNKTDATIRFSPLKRATTTDSGGLFEFTGLPIGHYQLSTDKAGYASKRITIRAKPYTNPNAHSSTQCRVEITLSVPVLGGISGAVHDSTDEPVPFAVVRAFRPRYESTQVVWLPQGIATTDDRGEYRLFNLPTGKYIVSATPPRLQSTAPDSSISDQQAFYPGTVSTSDAASVIVQQGMTSSGINVKLRRTAVFEISGQVQGPPMVYSLLLIERSTNSTIDPVAVAQTDKHGAFRFPHVEHGLYTLAAESNDSDHSFAGRTEIDVSDHNIQDTSVLAQPIARLSGAIRCSDTNSTPSLQGMTVKVVSADIRMPKLREPLAKVQADGTFKIEGIEPDRYKLVLDGLPSGFFVSRISVGNLDQPIEGFSPLSLREAALVVLSPDAASVKGSVESNGVPSQDVPVVLINNDRLAPSSSLSRLARTEEDGSFSFKNLPPGSYRLAAVYDLDIASGFPPSLNASIAADGQTISLNSKEDKTVNLKTVITGSLW